MYTRSSSEFVFNPKATMTLVSGRTFINEVVPLDGFSYRDCTFINVKLKYNGTTPIDFGYDKFKGSTNITTDNPAIVQTFGWLGGIGFIPPNIPILGPDGHPIDSIQRPDLQQSTKPQ